MPTARFHQVSLIAGDVAASLAFYRRLGLDIPAEDVWTTGSGPHHAKSAPAGSAELELESRSLARSYNAGFRAERGRVIIDVALESRAAVDTLWHELVSESVQGLQPPFDGFWGARCAIVEDPDGNPVRLTSPVDPARRTAPPEL